MLNFSHDGTLTFPHFVVKTYPWKKFSRKLTAQKVLVKAVTATCKTADRYLFKLPAGSRVWLSSYGMFSGHNRLLHHRMEKKILKPLFVVKSI